MSELVTVLKKLLRDVTLFTRYASGLKLRTYQVDVARAIIDSVVQRKGLSIVVVFPRQSGKNELQAQIETYMLTLFSQLDAEIVKVSPTWKPQTLNAMRRLERVLSRNLITRDRWKKESGYIYRVGSARIFFLSGAPTANVVGATASTLLECDEAQDVLTAKWDKEFAPMAASTNATRVYWGTMWTSRTLLARELRLARQAEKQDGVQRAFILNADDVAKDVPAYGIFVAGQIAKLGRNHPLVRTQFYSEEIDTQCGMFPPERRAMMQGEQSCQLSATSHQIYALLLDIGGEDEMASTSGLAISDESNAGKRDSTAMTIVQIDLSTLADELIRLPTYRVVNRYLWTGEKHSTLYAQIKALAESWQARYIVVDATGIGAGLASFLDSAFPNQVIPFVFSARSKSDLGWDFISLIETGRYKEPKIERGELRVEIGKANDYSRLTLLSSLFWRQVEFCQSTVLDGPGKVMQWSVPDGTRDPETGAYLHDDLLISAALCAVLDKQHWGTGESQVAAPVDPMQGLREAF
ncbi:MAG: hypothetical protein JW908_12485 [Anaerolineales bacterium]|nr:hypothetical protein [Anaerolineales bacterium]